MASTQDDIESWTVSIAHTGPSPWNSPDVLLRISMMVSENVRMIVFLLWNSVLLDSFLGERVWREGHVGESGSSDVPCGKLNS